MTALYIGGEFSEQELFRELKNQARRERIGSEEEFRDIIDMLVESKRALGFLGEQEDSELIKENLKNRWTDIRDELEKNRPINILK